MNLGVHTDVSSLTWWQWLLLAAVLLGQSLFIFRDAQKRGARAWLWGLYGLTSCPTAYLVYWFCVMRKKKSKHIEGMH
jgi:hypothetical protein